MDEKGLLDEKAEKQNLAYIVFSKGPLAGNTYPVTQNVLTLGRANTNDIVIPDLKISRLHARLSLHNGSWEIERLSQNKALRVEQEKITRATLAHNNEVTLGENVAFRFLLELSPDLDGLSQATQTGIIPQVISPATMLATPADLGIASLEFIDNTTGDRKEYPLVQDEINVGHDPGNDIVLPEDFVSNFHLQIFRKDGQWTILHPQTAETEYSLLFNGRRIDSKKSFQKQLKHNDTFRIENDLGAMVTLKYNDGRTETQELLPLMQVIPLDTDVIKIGRASDNTVHLNHPLVSNHHAQLVKDTEQKTHRLIDLNSTNHTYVNGLPVTSTLLHHGDEIRIGAFKIIYETSQLTLYDESGGIRIDAIDIRQVRSNHTLLDDISLSIPQRSFVALVGTSGAGKSTLMDALSGLRKAVGGQIYYNGQDYYQNIEAFKTQIGYVPQDEIIHRDLTVERVLYYTARLRLPKDFTPEQIEQRINEVLDDVEMQHRRKNLVKQLSGGQRKRVSIALELLARPNIFFLDEPTSGLDPGLDRKMMILLRKLADKGHTIVLVTHATNNINLCDYVCFLAPGGRLAYYGPPEGAKAYFKQPDFAEIYSMLDPGDGSLEHSQKKAEEFKESDLYEQFIEDPLSHKPKENIQLLHLSQKQGQTAQRGKFWRQFRILVVRYLELLKNDRVNLIILLLQAPISALLLIVFINAVGTDGFNPTNLLWCPTTSAIIAPQGFPDPPTPINPVVSHSCSRVISFLTNNPAGHAYAHQMGGVEKALQTFLISGPGNAVIILFIMAFAAIMFGCVNSIREIIKEAPIYQRERAVNLGIMPYLCSKVVVLGFLCMFQSLILVGLVAILNPYHQSIILPAFLEVYITILLTSLAGLMIGLVISSVVSNSDRAVSFVPLILIPQVIFSGATFPLTSRVLEYLGMLFPARWAMASLGSTVGLHSDKINGDLVIPGVYSYIGTLYSTNTTQEATRYLLLTWGALILMILLFGGLTIIFLKRKDARV